MKVLVITNLYPPEFLGGYELGCAQMAQALVGAGHDVRVVTSVSAHAAEPEERRVHRVLELPPVYNPGRMHSVSPELQRYFHLLACDVNPANVRAIGEVIEDFSPDVAYLWNLLGLGGLGVLSLLDHHGISWVWHIMDVIPLQLCVFGAGGDQLARELGTVFPGRYVMCSRHVLGELRAGGVELGERIHVIPNWVHGEPPAPRNDVFAGGVLRILSASGTLSEAKGTQILIESAALLRESGNANFRIDIYGREDDPCFRVMAHRLGVADVVRFMGPRNHDELLRLYHDYDAFVFPTWSRDPFPFVVLEAAGAGCLPMITDDCGAAEWLIDGIDCLKARRDGRGFAVRIAEVLRCELDFAGLARRAQAVVWREFHVSGAVREVERVLAQAADERRSRRGSPAEFFALARFAEGLAQVLLEEAQV